MEQMGTANYRLERTVISVEIVPTGMESHRYVAIYKSGISTKNGHKM